MDPQHTGDLLKHLEKQNELLKEAHKTMSHELQKLMVEEQMMMHKLYELMVTHRKKRWYALFLTLSEISINREFEDLREILLTVSSLVLQEMNKTQTVFEGKETLEEASSLAIVPTGDEEH